MRKISISERKKYLKGSSSRLGPAFGRGLRIEGGPSVSECVTRLNKAKRGGDRHTIEMAKEALRKANLKRRGLS